MGQPHEVLSAEAPVRYCPVAGLNSAQLCATANASGKITYSPPSGTVLPAGNGQVLIATFTPADPARYRTATTTVTINMAKAAPTVIADNLSRQYGSANPSFTSTITGFVIGETPSVLTDGRGTGISRVAHPDHQRSGGQTPHPGPELSVSRALAD